MYKIPLDLIISKIKEKTSLSDKDLQRKIKDKMDALAGLISEEGAAHILANELGVKLMEESGKLKIKNVLGGMKSVEITGKVTRVFEVKEFNKEGRKGKLCSFVVGDETGTIRVVAWNDKADIVSRLNENSLVKVENGYTKDNMGKVEIHLGDRANLTILPEGSEKIELKQEVRTRKKIVDLKENEENVEVMGTIVQVFDPRFFPVDKETGKKVIEKEGSYYFNDVKVESPDFSYVTNIFLDDGSENIRTVLWKSQSQRLFSMSHDEILKRKNIGFEEIKNELLGKVVKFVGRTQKNEMFQRVEYVPQLVFLNPEPDEEIKRLNEEIEKASKETPEDEILENIQPKSAKNSGLDNDSTEKYVPIKKVKVPEKPSKNQNEKGDSLEMIEDIDDLQDLDLL